MIRCSILAACDPAPLRPRCPACEIRRRRAAVVWQARVGACVQECLDSGRASVPDRPVQWRYPAQRGHVRIGARAGEVLDDRPLACRVPVCCAGFTDHRCVQGPGVPPVAGADVSASHDQIPGYLAVVSERRRVQRGVPFVDLGVTLGDEELVAACQLRRHQQRRSVKECPGQLAIARRDRDQQPGKICGVSHAALYLAGASFVVVAVLKDDQVVAVDQVDEAVFFADPRARRTGQCSP